MQSVSKMPPMSGLARERAHPAHTLHCVFSRDILCFEHHRVRVPRGINRGDVGTGAVHVFVTLVSAGEVKVSLCIRQAGTGSGAE